MSLIWLTHSFESVPWCRYVENDSYLLRQAQYIYFMTHFQMRGWVNWGTSAWIFLHVTQIRRIHKRDVTSADVLFICGGAYDGSSLIYLYESRTIIICRKPSISISWHTFKWVSESNHGHAHEKFCILHIWMCHVTQICDICCFLQLSDVCLVCRMIVRDSYRCMSHELWYATNLCS